MTYPYFDDMQRRIEESSMSQLIRLLIETHAGTDDLDSLQAGWAAEEIDRRFVSLYAQGYRDALAHAKATAVPCVDENEYTEGRARWIDWTRTDEGGPK